MTAQARRGVLLAVLSAAIGSAAITHTIHHAHLPQQQADADVDTADNARDEEK